MKNLLKIMLIMSACQFAVVSASEADDNVLVQMFVWWNGAISDPQGFTEEAFRRYYTEDAAIVINGKEVVRGIAPLVEHFKRIQQRVESVEIVLPFEEGLQAGNRIFTYHKIRSRAEGRDGLSHVMGYAVVEDGKIALADFLSYAEPQVKAETAD